MKPCSKSTSLTGIPGAVSRRDAKRAFASRTTYAGLSSATAPFGCLCCHLYSTHLAAPQSRSGVCKCTSGSWSSKQEPYTRFSSTLTRLCVVAVQSIPNTARSTRLQGMGFVCSGVYEMHPTPPHPNPHPVPSHPIPSLFAQVFTRCILKGGAPVQWGCTLHALAFRSGRPPSLLLRNDGHFYTISTAVFGRLHTGPRDTAGHSTEVGVYSTSRYLGTGTRRDWWNVSSQFHC